MKRRYPCHRDSPLPPFPQFSEEILNNLDPQYSIVLNDLINSFTSSKYKTQHKALFDAFADKYLALPELWRYRSRLDHPKNVANRCLSQFYYIYFDDCDKNLLTFDKCGPILWTELDDYSKLDIVNLFGFQDKAKHLLDYPHGKLKKIFNFYEAYGDKILTQKEYLNYQKTLKHQEEIGNSLTIEERFQCFTKIEDERTAIQNIELLLVEDPCNKLLWQSYMGYLKDRHPKVYLDILYKYIRFFISDLSAKQLYEQEKQRIESMPEFAEMKSLSYFLFKKPESKSIPKTSKKLLKNVFKSHVRQSFSLPMPIIRYMLSSSTVRQKNILFETCKQMFLLQPTPICCNISFTPKRSIHNCIYGQSFRLSRAPPTSIQNLLLTKTLTIDAPKSPDVLSNIINRIAKCEAWSLDAVGQTVAWKELQFLLEADTVKRFSFIDGKIIDTDESLIPIEDIVEALPFTTHFVLNSAAFTQNTFAKLAALNRETKFKYFEIGNVDCSFNFKDFERFVKAHIQPKGEIILRVERSTTLDSIRNVNQKLKTMFESWIPEDSKPKIIVI